MIFGNLASFHLEIWRILVWQFGKKNKENNYLLFSLFALLTPNNKDITP